MTVCSTLKDLLFDFMNLMSDSSLLPHPCFAGGGPVIGEVRQAEAARIRVVRNL